MKKFLSVFVLFICFWSYSFAGGPDQWIWGEDETESKGNWTYLSTMVKQSKWRQASGKLHWLLTNTPDLNVALYINASKVYEGRVKEEKEAVKKAELQDSVLWVYDTRIAKYGDEAKVLKRKARVAYKYLYKRPESAQLLYDLYKKNYELNGDKMYIKSSKYYFKSTCLMLKEKKKTQADVLTIYDEMNSFLDRMEQKYATDEKKLGYVTSSREAIDEALNRYVKVDCDFVMNNYGPKYKENPDLKLAKKINKLLVSNKCVENELFISTADMILEKEPSFGMYKLVGKIYNKQGDTDKAYDYFTKAIELSEDSIKTAELYYDLAMIDNKKGRKVKARENAYAAANHSAEMKSKAYTFVGDLYFNSALTCATNDVLKDRLVYIAAYDKYKAAGASGKMAAAKKQFPTMEDIFLRNKKEGDVMNTGCWVGESVTLMKR